MLISEYLKTDNIILGAASKDRWELIGEMLERALASGEIKPEDHDTIRKALTEREKSMSTGIGKGVAIPHCSSVKVDEATVVLAVCANGIDFDAIDNEPVRIAILLLVPKNKLAQHIKTLANIAKLMSIEELRSELLNSKTPDATLDAIRKYESLKK
ncbi:MAG: PTS sugar transporter subunit IIA [Spirochaetes bacterium]|nr:MAG: PTS sugar transporter subunit IIA [Spirochaetota bacterium]